MKKITTFLLSLLLLSSCFWWDNEAESPYWEEISSSIWNYSNEKFSVETPSSWEKIPLENLPSPKNSKIELALSSENFSSWYANNMIILSQELSLDSDFSSVDYAISNNVWAVSEYLNYKKIDSDKFKFPDDEDGVLYIFEAKYNSKTPTFKFIQTWKVCEKKSSFLLTIGVNLSIKDTSKYEDLLKTFSCK